MFTMVAEPPYWAPYVFALWALGLITVLAIIGVIGIIKIELAKARGSTIDIDAMIAEARQRWALAVARLASYDLRGLVGRDRLRLGALAAQLTQLSPLGVLERGYAIVFDAQGRVLKSAAAVSLGDPIQVQLARGRLEAEVKKKER